MSSIKILIFFIYKLNDPFFYSVSRFRFGPPMCRLNQRESFNFHIFYNRTILCINYLNRLNIKLPSFELLSKLIGF